MHYYAIIIILVVFFFFFLKKDIIIVYRSNFWDSLSSSKICYRDRPWSEALP